MQSSSSARWRGNWTTGQDWWCPAASSVDFKVQPLHEELQELLGILLAVSREGGNVFLEDSPESSRIHSFTGVGVPEGTNHICKGFRELLGSASSRHLLPEVPSKTKVSKRPGAAQTLEDGVQEACISQIAETNVTRAQKQCVMSHLVLRVERLRGPGRYHVEGAMGSRGLCPYAEQGRGTREAPETPERSATSQSGWFRPECQAAQCSP